MKVKTSELEGTALDWAVAKCEVAEPVGSFLDGVVPHPGYNNFHPSTDWSQAGPIIEREEMGFAKYGPKGSWKAVIGATPRGTPHYGPTPLIAIMRCFVSSRLGDEVEIPEELK